MTHQPFAPRLSQRALDVQPSATLAMNARAKALVSAGRDLVLFGAGEPDFPTPPHIIEATARALHEGRTRYTPTSGIPELRSAVATRLDRTLGLAYRPEDVIVTPGAKMALYELFQVLCAPGDEVVIFAPYWVSYPDMVRLAGGTPVIVPTRAEDDFLPDPARLAAALTPRTKLVILNSPGNPTGAVYPRETLEALTRVLEPTNAMIVSDDIYDRIRFDGRPLVNVAQFPGWQDRTIIVNGVSKTWAMTGFRIGWAVGPSSVIAAMGRVQDQATSNATTFAQYAALAALQGPEESLGAMVDAFRERRDVMVSALRAIPGVTCPMPGGAFYALPSIAGVLGKKLGDRRITTDLELCEALLDHGLALVPGTPFGAPGHVRLSYATSMEEIRKGLERLRVALSPMR